MRGVRAALIAMLSGGPARRGVESLVRSAEEVAMLPEVAVLPNELERVAW